jgi:dTDP-4-dehydrorhamnose 3,5-epimerase
MMSTHETLAAPLQFKRHADARGTLVALEAMREVPFAIERIYYIVGAPAGTSRGHHAHRELQQLAIALSGGVTMLMDDGRRQWRVRLDASDRGLLVPPMVWHEMHDFAENTVLLMLASARYDEADYIRDRAEFTRLTR